MHQFIIRFIGIITVACIGNGNYDCNTSPYTLQAFVANGLSRHHPCAKEVNVATPVHEAYIRIESEEVFGSFWSFEERACTDSPKCTLYPLHKGDVIEIKGLSDGAKLDTPFVPSTKIKWKEIYEAVNQTPPKLAGDAAARSLGTLLINAGTWMLDDYGPDGMLITKGVFETSDTNLTITIKGTNKILKVSNAAPIDIINLPPSLVYGTTGSHVPHPDKEHFFLHYTLADPAPDYCVGPEDTTHMSMLRKIKRLFGKGDFVGSLACSNSNYP